jgi:hypothetical protein
MSYRATKSGFAAEAQRKTDSKYDEDEARLCLHWIQQVTGVSEIPASADNINCGRDEFYDLMKDGMILCKLVDKLIPGRVKWNEKTFQVPKIEGMRVMRERERIAMFNKAVTDYGVSETCTFPTESLYEKIDLAQVLTCIRAVGIEAQAKGLGPSNYWPKKAERQSRDWTDEQLRAGQNVIGLQMGSNKGASQAGMNMGNTRHIVD